MKSQGLTKEKPKRGHRRASVELLYEQLWLRIASRWRASYCYSGHRTWSHARRYRQEDSSAVSSDRLASSSIALINHTVRPFACCLSSCRKYSLLCLLPATWLRVFDRPHQFPRLSDAASSSHIFIYFIRNCSPDTWYFYLN
jgi:hypothetical protein